MAPTTTADGHDDDGRPMTDAILETRSDPMTPSRVNRGLVNTQNKSADLFGDPATRFVAGSGYRKAVATSPSSSAASPPSAREPNALARSFIRRQLVFQPQLVTDSEKKKKHSEHAL